LAGKGRLAREANLTATCEMIVCNIWGHRRLTTPWASMACPSLVSAVTHVSEMRLFSLEQRDKKKHTVPIAELIDGG
jgi:hypothetical protein